MLPPLIIKIPLHRVNCKISQAASGAAVYTLCRFMAVSLKRAIFSEYIYESSHRRIYVLFYITLFCAQTLKPGIFFFYMDIVITDP